MMVYCSLQLKAQPDIALTALRADQNADLITAVIRQQGDASGDSVHVSGLFLPDGENSRPQMRHMTPLRGMDWNVHSIGLLG